MSNVPADPAEEYLRRGWWSPDSIAELFRAQAATRPDGVAYVDSVRRWTWAECDAYADRVAAVLRGLGIDPGDRVAVLLPDSGLQRSVYVGCERAGAVIVGIAARTEAAEVAQQVTRTDAGLLIAAAGPDATELLARIGAMSTPLAHCLLIEGEDPVVRRWGEDGPGEAVAIAPVGQAGPGRGPDDVWFLNFTSGTTGLPKAVMQTQNRWFYLAGAASSGARIGPGDTILSAVPGPYGFGLWTGYVLPVLHGAPCHLVERFTASEILRRVEEHRVTVLACVTTQLIMMLNDPAFAKTDLSSLRVVFTGGERVPRERAAQWEAASGSKVLQFYGSNEAGPVSCTSLDDDDETRLTTAGPILEGVEWLLLEGTDEEDDRGAITVGQLAVRSPGAHGGYWADPVANRQLYTDDGYMILPDVVAIDERRRLRVVGRKSDIIIRGGRNISVAVVEQAVAGHPDVAMAVALPVPDPVFGERIGVAVTLRDSRTKLGLDELVAHLRAHGSGKAYLPEHLLVLPEMPMSAGGKADKRRLQELFGTGA